MVNVRGFNLANNDTLSASVDVLEWSCETSNISIDPLFTNQNSPFATLTEDGFTITADITVDCMKMEQYTTRWEVQDSSDETVVTTLADGAEFVSAPNALPPGEYAIEINVTMLSSFFDLADKTAISYAYVNVHRCQPPNITVDMLFASEDQPYIALIENGFTITIDYSTDCAVMEQTNISWNILDSAQQNVLDTSPNAAELVSLPYDLPAGSYVIRINMTMSSSIMDISHKHAVAYGYVNVVDCQPPLVTLNPLANESEPFIAYDIVGFTVTADFSVDCPPMERLTAQWDILDDSQTVLRTVPNATQLTSSPYDLPIGVYAVRLNTTIWSSRCDLSQKGVTSFTYVNVEKSFLAAGIDGSGHINATFNSSVFLSAYNLTYASYTPYTDKSGMTFEWRCKRTAETWPEPLPTQSYLPHSGTNGGCFDDVGPGVLGFAANQWNFTIYAGYLEPLVEHQVHFLVQKDVFTANASVSLYVQQPLAPNISIRQV